MKSYEFYYNPNIKVLAYDLCEWLLTYNEDPIFLCIGESKLVSDCIGAVVGTMLTSTYQIPCYVYGNLTYNITNENLESFFSFVKKEHPNKPIVIIDSGLGSLEQVGTVVFTQSARVGALTNPNAKIIGDCQLLGMVNTSGINSLLFLKSVKLKTAIQMSSFLAKAITLALVLKKQATQKPSFKAKNIKLKV